MEISQNFPTTENKHNWEIFRHKEYTNASKEYQAEIRQLSSQSRYDYETERCFFDIYFPQMDCSEFFNASILEIGSYTGGSLVKWVERYGFSSAQGIDINPIFAEAANSFAKEKGVNASFDTGYAESLPYLDASFDYIVSYDVFEHVRDIELVMNECLRVLKPGGKLLVVFPPFFQPLEAHLTLVTNVPALHWIFSGQTLTKAYNKIIKRRGQEAYWYALDKEGLSDWEKLPSLNGITVRKFKKIFAKNKSWKRCYWGKNPILSDGRRSSKLLFRILRLLFIIPARLPILEELFLGRICCGLRKEPSVNDDNEHI